MDLSESGPGAMLSPLPPLERGSVGEHLLADLQSSIAQAIADLNARIAEFSVRNLMANS